MNELPLFIQIEIGYIVCSLLIGLYLFKSNKETK